MQNYCGQSQHDYSRGRQRGSITEIEIAHHGLVRIDGKSFGRAAGSSAGHDIDEIEHGKSLYEAEYHRDENESGEKRPGDEFEFRPAAPAIDFHRFVKVPGN